ncbi:Phospholipase A I [Zea mays]|uniref:Large ribosomal subunit protein bL21m n=1 Tax=Zea mays TaxID=4577 RepID=A0A1D6PPV5_MAIZE|nr:Phospholipase A I [Zea mays]
MAGGPNFPQPNRPQSPLLPSPFTFRETLVLNRVLMLGSQAQTVIGRPILPDAVVHAVVEEHYRAACMMPVS